MVTQLRLSNEETGATVQILSLTRSETSTPAATPAAISNDGPAGRPSTNQPRSDSPLATVARNALRLPVPRSFPQRDPRDNCHVLSTTVIGDKIVTRLLCFRPDGTTYVVEEVTFIEDFPPPQWKPIWPPRPIPLPPGKKGTIVGVRPGPGGNLIPGLPMGGW